MFDLVLQVGVVLVQVLFSLAELVLLSLYDFRLLGSQFRSWLVALAQAVVVLTDLLGLDALGHCHDVSVQSQDLRHQVDNLESVVWFLSQRVSKQVQLFEVLELGQLQQKLVQVSQPVVAQQQGLQKLVFLDARDVLNLVVLAAQLLDAEIGGQVVQVRKLNQSVSKPKVATAT